MTRQLVYKQREDKVAADFQQHIRNHEITVLHQSGEYRHYRCGQPDSSNMEFFVLTYPGTLVYTGDMGEFIFQRTRDMLRFMSRASQQASYMAEKCVAVDRHSGIDEFSSALVDAWLAEQQEECLETCDPDDKLLLVDELTDQIDHLRREYLDFSGNAAEVLCQRALWEIGSPLQPDEMPNFRVYTYRFLWCLHAIEWLAARVGEAKPATTQPTWLAKMRHFFSGPRYPAGSGRLVRSQG